MACSFTKARAMLLSHKSDHRRTFMRLMLTLCCALAFGEFGQCDITYGGTSLQRHSWEQPGCHLVGHTRVVKIPNCVPFHVTTNACRGFCVSYAIPSPSHTLTYNPNYVITSRAECCGIIETQDIPVQVRCVDGVKEIVFKAASSCDCSICRRE